MEIANTVVLLAIGLICGYFSGRSKGRQEVTNEAADYLSKPPPKIVGLDEEQQDALEEWSDGVTRHLRATF